MSKPVEHGTFVIERTFPADISRVFQAFADPAQKAAWFAAGATHGQEMDAEHFAALVEPLGRPLVQRSTLYQTL